MAENNANVDQVLSLKKFVQGYQKFYKQYFVHDKTLFNDLQNGQAPKTLVIGCCDSRVDPALITNCNPGDIFVVRNVANIVPTYDVDHSHHGTSSAIEYAVKVLKVENIIVLGHSKCGGIQALMNNDMEKFEFLKDWVEIVGKAKLKTNLKYSDLSMEEKCQKCEKAAICLSLENLLSYPWIHSLLEAGTINVFGWYFDFESGDLLSYRNQSGEFEEVAKNLSMTNLFKQPE